MEHRKGSRFRNPHLGNLRRGLHHLFLWWIGYYDDKEPIEEAPSDFSYPKADAFSPDEPTVTFVNHSTFLIQIDGLNILTDPVWGERASPFQFIGPTRQHAPPFAIEELTHVDYVLISHNHYDHLDLPTVLELKRRFPDIMWYVPLGLTEWFHAQGIHNVRELDWWDSHKAEEHLEVHAVPAQHYSGRGLLDGNKSLWAGWVVTINRPDRTKRSFYFVGDTGYNDVQFKQIGETFGCMDLSLIPIGVYRPTEFMKTVHTGPEDAVEIHLDVNSILSIGTHFGTFKLSSEPVDQPPYDLYQTMEEKGLPHHTFRVLKPGDTINW